MIGTIEIKVTAARPNMPLSPMFAFKGSPSSLRILEVPKKIGDWNITNINVVAHYPDNTTTETAATRTGNVWVATFEGCNISGKVSNGLEITADGIDEAGQNVQGYVLGAGDIFILERDADIEDAISKITMRYCETIPEHPTIGDFIVLEGVAKFYDGTKWISIDTDLSEYATKDELVAAVSSKAEISSVEAVADDVEDLSNSLSNYYTKSETSSAVEIQVALDGKQPTGDYALASQIPTNVSQLSNDAGYLTEHQSLSDYYTKNETSSNVEITTALNGKLDLSATADKALISQKLASNISDEHSTRVVVDEYDNVILQKYTTGWYVSKIEEGTGSPVVYTETDTYYAFVSNVRIEPSEDRMYFTVDCQDKQRNLTSKRQELFYTSSTSEFIINAVSWTANEAGHYIGIRLTITNAETPVWVDVARLVPDSSKYSGLLDTQITPNGQFVTPTQVKPFNYMLGYARRAQGSLFLFGRSSSLTPDENHFVTIDYNVGKLCFVGSSYYPWQLSMYDGTTFDPPLQMNYGYYSTIAYKYNGRIRNLYVNSNCWVAIQTVDAKNTKPYYIIAVEDENGSIIPDTNLYITGVAHPITFSTNKLSIETIDGVAGNITCTRQSTGTYQTELNYFAYEADLSAKADLSAIPTKTSELSNDSGFITEATYIEDANENMINADRSVSYIGDGTSYWQMVSKFQTIPKTINLEGTKTDSSYIPTGDLQDGDVKVHLTYDIDKWQIEIEVWDAGLLEWGVSQFFYDTQSSESATELNFGTSYIGSCVWTTPRVVINDNLVTESSLSSIIARLEARIAALENQ